jgi:membrane protease subunit (stomatin/prohibitin family)
VAIIDVVKWDGEGYGANSDDAVLAWKFPSQELSTWTQLIVNESQEAILVRGGAMDGPFGPGRHVLKSENIPVIGKLLNLPYGRSPYTAEVWFLNKAIPLDVTWGTSTPIPVQDPIYNIIIPVVAHGQYAIQIEHSRKFLVKLVGTMVEFDRSKMQQYLNGILLTTAKTVIAKELIKNKTSILEISALLLDISNAIKESMNDQIAEFGLTLVNFFVHHIDAKEDDQSVVRLRESLIDRADMNIRGYSYQQMRQFDVLEGAAKNEGSGMVGLGVGAGVGLGVGLPLGSSMGNQFATAMNQAPTPSVAPALGNCAKCKCPRQSIDAKFCASCGTSFAMTEGQQCVKCKAALPTGALFCIECGAPTIIKCSKCQAEMSATAKFCQSCGTPAS